MKKIIFLVLSLSFIIADINISGDGRIRPRLDIIDYGNSESSIDLYYLYRARLDINADIGGGWFFNTKLGTNYKSLKVWTNNDSIINVFSSTWDDE